MLASSVLRVDDLNVNQVVIRMLRIRMLSGEEVTTMPVEEVGSVREVKQRLHQLHGLPPRFRQRLIFQGTNLDDADKLDSPLDLILVVLSYSSPSQTEGKELTDATKNGSLEKAGVQYDRSLVPVECN